MDKEPGEKIYECGMRRFEISALLYELPLLLGALIIAWLLLGTYKLLILDSSIGGKTTAAFVALAALDALGLAIVFWTASFFPRRISVYPDRIRFKMIYKDRDVMFADVKELRPLTVAEARRALFSPGKVCLSPSVKGAVLLGRARGRDWVFCPEDGQKFLAAVEQARRGAAPATESTS